MHFHPLEISDAILIEPERRSDERGFFARVFCMEEFARAGLPTHFPQSNVSFNAKAGTVRGMHYQLAPHEEPKVVRCTRGAIYDVIVDLRPGSPTLHRSVGVELSAENGLMLYIPPGFAHGFQTLVDTTEVFYLMGDVYAPELARGVRWDDPALAISWPLPVSVIAERDLSYPAVER